MEHVHQTNKVIFSHMPWAALFNLLSCQSQWIKVTEKQLPTPGYCRI